MPTSSEFDRERLELSAVLASAPFLRSANLASLLAYVCHEYFAGQGDQLKEYSLAVEALGRPTDFDNKKDSVVRVEVHRLRKRLQEYYLGEGSNHSVQITIPAGRYAPKFVYLEESAVVEYTEAPPLSPGIPEQFSLTPVVYPVAPAGLPVRPGGSNSVWVIAAGCALAALGGVGLFAYFRPIHSSDRPLMASLPALVSTDEVRIMAGAAHPFQDSNGRVWSEDRYFAGGNTFDDPQHPIFGTREPQLFRTRREGTFRYDIPLRPGVYEMRLYFAETLYGESNIANGGESTRVFSVRANGRTLVDDLDVIADTGPSTADVRVFKDVSPAGDGKLHLDFPAVTNWPFLNAIEITPGLPGRLKPIRLITRDHSYADKSGNIWEPDRYSRGGQLVKREISVSSAQDPEVYRGERFGNLSYSIPVAKGRYGLRLHFAETWFGPDKPGHGGIGDRVFDVHCNGVTLLHNFDIFKEAGGGDRELVKVFHNVEPTAQGYIRLDMIPRRNYACINALEVLDESK